MDFRIEYVPLITAVVEGLKEFGVNGKWSILVAVILGMAISLGLDLVPEYALLALRGLMLGLAGPGLYRIGKRAGSAVVAAIGKSNGAPIGQG